MGNSGRQVFFCLCGFSDANFKTGFFLALSGRDALFVLFLLIVAFSRFGKVRLGNDDDKPEYSTVSWFAMLFGAGMGVGLVFWGVAEPLSHYIAPMAGIEPLTEEAARFSIRSCFMHWGVHPWACYAVVGLGLAYFQFRKKERTMVSNLLKPMIGEKHTYGIPGKAVDIFTTVLTVVGVATSFGMGCLQICAGLEYLFGIPNEVITWVIVIVILCFIYLKSAISGVGKESKNFRYQSGFICSADGGGISDRPGKRDPQYAGTRYR